jgi:chromosome partitioning protein
MMAKIVSVGNQKGGAGKTTVSMNLAGYLAKSYSVLVVDADEQASATKWAAQAENPPFPATVVGLAAAGGKIHRELVRLGANYDFVIVDCPPSIKSPAPQSAFLVSDLVLIPTRPSILDIWEVQATLDLVEKARTINEAVKAALVVNALQPQTQLGRDSLEALAGFAVHLTKQTLHHRTAYAQSAVVGGTVADISGAKAAQGEMDALCAEVLALLG